MIEAVSNEVPAPIHLQRRSTFVLAGLFFGTVACGGPKLPNPDVNRHDRTGLSVAMDSGWAMVGAPNQDTTGGVAPVADSLSKALLYLRSGSGASLHSTLRPSTSSTFSNFAVALDVSGNRAIVGANGDRSLVPNPGHGIAYVYEFDGSTWVEAARLFGDSTGTGFGPQVALAGDFAVVSQSPRGVWIYRREATSGAWVRDTMLAAIVSFPQEVFGKSVAIHDDVVVVGAIGGSSPNPGIAYVFRRAGSTWVQEAALTPIGGSSDQGFGWSTAVWNDVIVVGNPTDTTKGRSAGAAQVFHRGANSWVHVRTLFATDGASQHGFGTSVDVEGQSIIVGAPKANGDTIGTGAVYVYHQSNHWSQTGKLTGPGLRPADHFGSAVALSTGCALVGAPNHPPGPHAQKWSGAAFLFCELPKPPPPTGDVTDLGVICCEHFDPSGGVLFSTRIVNRGSSRAIGRRSVLLIRPDGVTHEISAPEAVVVEPGQTIEERHSWTAPATGATLGTYQLWLLWEQDDGVRTERATFSLGRNR